MDEYELSYLFTGINWSTYCSLFNAPTEADYANVRDNVTTFRLVRKVNV